jgi:hypothetical protein
MHLTFNNNEQSPALSHRLEGAGVFCANQKSKKPSYRLKGRGNFPYTSLYPTKNIIYLVSVGTQKFQETGVTRFVNFIEAVKPKKLFIVVADTLQRFNIELYENLDEKKSFEVAEARGRDWLEKYAAYFSRLQFAYEFIRWEELKKDNDYGKYLEDLQQWNQSAQFQLLLLESSKEYIKRRGDNSPVQAEKPIGQSVKFLNEECACLRVLAKNEDTMSLYYPGPPLSIFKYIIDYINGHDRVSNPFFYEELHATKGKLEKQKEQKEKSDKLVLFQELPYFKCNTLFFNEDTENRRLNVSMSR